MALSKKYKEAAAKIEAGKSYAPLEAVALVKEIATANFDETVEAHFRLGIDTRQADQQLRGTVSLPNGSGKTVRVAVFAEGDAARAAEEAGADIVGSDDLVAEIQAGNINFDAAVATPDQMAKVGRLGKVLGPRGLMPNPKLGTVTFTAEQLAENYGAIYDEILRMKPASAKGRYVKSVTVVSTMGPGVPVDSSVNRNYTEAQ